MESLTSSNLSQIGLPVLAGVASAASPPLARGVAGATHAWSSMRPTIEKEGERKRLSELGTGLMKTLFPGGEPQDEQGKRLFSTIQEISKVPEAAPTMLRLTQAILEPHTSIVKGAEGGIYAASKPLGGKMTLETLKESGLGLGNEFDRTAHELGFNPKKLSPEEAGQVNTTMRQRAINDYTNKLSAHIGALGDPRQMHILDRVSAVQGKVTAGLETLRKQEERDLQDLLKNRTHLLMKPDDPKNAAEIAEFRRNIAQRYQPYREQLITEAETSLAPYADIARQFGIELPSFEAQRKRLKDVRGPRHLDPSNYLR